MDWWHCDGNTDRTEGYEYSEESTYETDERLDGKKVIFREVIVTKNAGFVTNCLLFTFTKKTYIHQIIILNRAEERDQA